MDDRAGPGLVDERDILLDRVIGFHLEPVPVAPHRRANAFCLEQVGDLVGFDRVVEGGDLVAELLRQIDHLRHFVGAVAMVVDQYLALEHPAKRIHAEIARRHVAALGLILVPLALIIERLEPHFAGGGDIAHPGRGPALVGVNALGILAARHLEAVRRARKLHPLHGAGIDILEHHRAAAEQIGRAGQDLERGDPAIGQRAGEAGVLRPHAMFGPDVGARRRGRFIAVRIGVDPGRGIVAKVAVDVDDPGRDPLAGAVDDVGVRRDRKIGDRAADRHHLAIGEQHAAMVDPPALAVIDGGVADQGRHARVRRIGRGIRVEVDLDRLGQLGGRRRHRARPRQQRQRRQRRDPHHPYFTPCISFLSGQLSNSRSTPTAIANSPIF